MGVAFLLSDYPSLRSLHPGRASRGRVMISLPADDPRAPQRRARDRGRVRLGLRRRPGGLPCAPAALAVSLHLRQAQVQYPQRPVRPEADRRRLAPAPIEIGVTSPLPRSAMNTHPYTKSATYRFSRASAPARSGISARSRIGSASSAAAAPGRNPAPA